MKRNIKVTVRRSSSYGWLYWPGWFNGSGHAQVNFFNTVTSSFLLNRWTLTHFAQERSQATTSVILHLPLIDYLFIHSGEKLRHFCDVVQRISSVLLLLKFSCQCNAGEASLWQHQQILGVSVELSSQFVLKTRDSIIQETTRNMGDRV